MRRRPAGVNSGDGKNTRAEGGLVVLAGILFHGGWMALALATLTIELRERRRRGALIAIA